MKRLYLILFLVLLASPAAADPISAIVAAVSSFFAGGSVLATLASALLRSLVKAGISLLVAKLRKRKQKTPGIQSTHTTSGGTEPQATVLGRFATRGHLVYQCSYHENNAWLAHVVELGDLPGATLHNLILDGVYADLGPVDSLGLRPILPKTEEGIPYGYIAFFDGTQTTAHNHLVSWRGGAADRPWTADHILTGTCYAVLYFYRRDHLYPSGVPRYAFELDGPPLYDIRKDSTMGGNGSHRFNDPASWDQTTNPLVIAYNVLRGIALPGGDIWGGGFPAEDLPYSEWAEAMDACDQLVAGTGRTQFEAGFEVKFEEAPADFLEELFSAANAQIVETGGYWYPIVGSATVASATISDDDVLISQAWQHDPFPGLENTFNAVTTTYTSPASLWEASTLETIVKDEWVAEDGRQKLFELNLPMVYSAEQARQLTDALLRENRRFRTHRLPLSGEYARLRPLQNVHLSLQDYGYDAKTFRITEAAYDLQTLNVSLSLRETDPADFDPDPGLELPETPHPTGPIPVTDAGVIGLAVAGETIAAADGKAHAPAIRIVWDGKLSDTCTGLTFQIRVQGRPEAEADTVSTTNVAGGNYRHHPVQPNADYEVRGKAIAPTRQTEWSGWLPVTTPNVRIDLDDLADEVTQAIDTAQAAADLAAQDATQALLDAATVQDNLTNAVASLSVDYTAVQIAAQAAEDAQLAAETAENSAAEHRGVVVSTAIDLLPSDFRDDDRYWAHAISGDPATKGGVTSSIGFRDVAGQGRVAWVTADLASNAHLAPKGYISPVQGRRYRMTIVARHLGPLGAGPHFSSQWRKFNENYGFEGSFGQQNISFATQDTWETFASDYTMSGDDAAYLFAFPYFIAAYQNPSAEIEIARVLIEDVTESAGAAGAASAAANSASVAGASETEAGQSAAAAQTAKTAAETARAGAEVAQTTAATSASDAENAAASAATSANIAARIGPRGACVIDDPLFDSYQQGGWNAWQTAPVALPNEVYPTGNTLHFDIGAVNAGTYIANSSTWSGAQNADAYVVEVEFTLLSGAVTGAGVLLDWDVPGDRRRQIPLSDMLRDPVTIGQVTVAQAVFTRPDMGGATFVDHDLYLMANFSSFGLTAKNIKFHRMSVRVATNEELGQGQVASQISAAVTDEAIARASAVDALTSVLTSQQSQIDGISSSVTQQGTTLATLDGKVQAMTGLTATTVDVNGETRISGIQATSYANPDGSGGSLLKLIGDDVVAEGTLSANKLVVGLGKNLLGNTDFADGLQGWDNKGGLGSSREDASIGIRAAGSSWAGKYYPTLVVHQASAGTDGYLDITYRPPMVNGVAPAYGVSISDNTGWVEASVYASAHRCIVELRMEFRNHNGDVLSYTPLLASTTAMSDAGNPDKWPRLWGKAAVPTGAAYVTVHIRKKATNAGSNDSWMFLHKPQLAETTGSAIQPAPYSPQGSTLINGNRLATGAVTAEKIDVNELSAITANIGHFKSAASGERVEIEDDRIRVFDSSDVARVVIGRLT
ncbi:hypothetical protein O4H48_16595 [Rhodobacteraceae bacterium G21628-S1]|nr:hypothetical protein [Rhodobacteraceae bacterium G21628-S1]